MSVFITDSLALNVQKDGVTYSWTFFHLSFVFASLYLMEVLTGWSTFQ